MEWISVKDKLPNQDEKVWVWSPYYNGDCPLLAQYISGNWHDPDFYDEEMEITGLSNITEEVTYWCYPEPPKE